MRLIEFLGIPEMEATLAKRGPHGGKRAGAGGPKLLDRPVRRTVYLDQRHVDQINAWEAWNEAMTFSEALRAILDSVASNASSPAHGRPVARSPRR